MLLENISSYLKDFGIPVKLATGITGLIMILTTILAGYFIMRICRRYIIKWIEIFAAKSQNKLDDIFIKNKLPNKVSLIIPPVFVYFLSDYVIASANSHLLYLVHLVCILYMVCIFIIIANSLLNSVNEAYEHIDTVGQAPIKSVIQMIKIMILIVAIIVFISLMINQSPWTLLKAMGALTAVTMLVFKDAILGLVAGVQLSAQRMLRKGDWIEMPQYGANGDVIDISLTTVKVQNFDKTIVSIPTYALVSNSFQNWRGMTESGGRRIKRSINLDMNSFRFLEKEDIHKLKKIELLKDYLDNKEKEISDYNGNKKVNEHSINGRRLTNVGTYRYYIKHYLLNHSKIHNNMTFIVRQLQPTEKGLPLEIYVFTNDTNWVSYEEIQADIFDHLLTVAAEFDLSLYQAPTGSDFKRALAFNGS